MTATTIADVRHCIEDLYPTNSIFRKFLLFGRPSICPFHSLIDSVPDGSSVLDIGCGAGLFLNVLAYRGKISRGVGFDAALAPVEIAREAGRHNRVGKNLVFEHVAVEANWPAGQFDVVSMIDVIHHVSPGAQRGAIEQAVKKVAPGGLFLFKDIAVRPLWRAWANRLHDLVMARQWIHYVPSEKVVDWVENAGLKLQRRETINMLWYGHELLAFRRDAADTDRRLTRS